MSCFSSEWIRNEDSSIAPINARPRRFSPSRSMSSPSGLDGRNRTAPMNRSPCRLIMTKTRGRLTHGATTARSIRRMLSDNNSHMEATGCKIFKQDDVKNIRETGKPLSQRDQILQALKEKKRKPCRHVGSDIGASFRKHYSHLDYKVPKDIRSRAPFLDNKPAVAPEVEDAHSEPVHSPDNRRDSIGIHDSISQGAFITHGAFMSRSLGSHLAEVKEVNSGKEQNRQSRRDSILTQLGSPRKEQSRQSRRDSLLGSLMSPTKEQNRQSRRDSLLGSLLSPTKEHLQSRRDSLLGNLMSPTKEQNRQSRRDSLLESVLSPTKVQSRQSRKDSLLESLMSPTKEQNLQSGRDTLLAQLGSSEKEQNHLSRMDSFFAPFGSPDKEQNRQSLRDSRVASLVSPVNQQGRQSRRDTILSQISSPGKEQNRQSQRNSLVQFASPEQEQNRHSRRDSIKSLNQIGRKFSRSIHDFRRFSSQNPTLPFGKPQSTYTVSFDAGASHNSVPEALLSERHPTREPSIPFPMGSDSETSAATSRLLSGRFSKAGSTFSPYQDITNAADKTGQKPPEPSPPKRPPNIREVLGAEVYAKMHRKSLQDLKKKLAFLPRNVRLNRFYMDRAKEIVEESRRSTVTDDLDNHDDV